MTERGRSALQRDATSLRIGPSVVRRDGDGLALEIDEVTVPLPSRVRGRVRLVPTVRPDRAWTLDEGGRHRWRPLAPCARVEVVLERPALRWTGHGYLDSNEGDEPLEDAFVRWHWSRATLADGGTAVLYDVRRRSGGPLSLALRFGSTGEVQRFEPPPPASLPPGLWRVARCTRSESGHPARLVQTFEDAPFYARSLVASRLLGESVTAVHESLSLERFRRAWVRALLPFRMPRRGGGRLSAPRVSK